MTDPAPAGETDDLSVEMGDERTGLPWWTCVVLGLFALGIAANLLGVRTCL